jgi:hypothetical protein
MEPKIGTDAYLLSIMNPFRRPMCMRHLSPNVSKGLTVGGVLLFALVSWSFRGNGLLGLGLAALVTALWLLVIAIHVEGALRMYAIAKNFEARIANWKSDKK